MESAVGLAIVAVAFGALLLWQGNRTRTAEVARATAEERARAAEEARAEAEEQARIAAAESDLRAVLEEMTTRLPPHKGTADLAGRWGQIGLRILLENTDGLREGLHWEENPTHTDDGKPDFVLRLPGGGSVAMDSKAVKADRVKQEIRKLGARGYAEHHTFPYTLCYLAAEGEYVAALSKDPDLPGYALERRVMLITPHSAPLALFSLAMLWQKEEADRIGGLNEDAWNGFSAWLAARNETRKALQKLVSRFDEEHETYKAKIARPLREIAELRGSRVLPEPERVEEGS